MTKIAFCVFQVLYLNFVFSTAEYTNVIQLKNGKIRGLQLAVAENNKKFEFYQAVKFGSAARFQKPQPVKAWSEVYNATEPGKNCIQFGRIVADSDENHFSEDCLYLNVYKPIVNAKADTKLETMVWIYGGAFEMGGIFGQNSISNPYDGRYIATMGEVIVVTLNYRVGPLGFMSIEKKVPPNLGLHDQILGLKWVQENIAAFGGDPKKVTIFGESAGSMSVASLVLSPMAKGLFRRAVAQSGSPAVEAITESVSRSHAKTQSYASKLNCTTTSGSKEDALLKCLLGKSITQLQQATRGDLSRNQHFVPVYGDELLPVRPAVALKSGKFNYVDYLYGVTRDEGTIFIPQFFPELLSSTRVANCNHYDVLLKANITKTYIKNLMGMYAEKAAFGSEVADYYVDRRLPRDPTQDDYRLAIANAWGDSMMVCPSVLYGQELAKHLPPTNRIYAYRLMQRTPDRLKNLRRHGDPPQPSWIGIPHGSDQYYLFNYDRTLDVKAENELAKFMINSWTNFAKTGKPTKDEIWSEAVQRGINQSVNYSTRYMHLEAGHFSMVENYFRETCEQFWTPKIFN